MLAALVVAGIVVLLLGAYLAARGLSASPPDSSRRDSRPGGEVEVCLAVKGGDPASPRVQRMVRDVAARTFSSMPNVSEVVVRNGSGGFLGRAERVRTAPAAVISDAVRFPAHPFGFAHPHPPLAPEDDAVGLIVEHALAGVVPPQPAESWMTRRPLSEVLDLPPGARQRLRNPDDPVDVVRAVLEESGLPTLVDDDVVLSRGRAVVVVRAPTGDPVTSGMLNRAYFRFRQIAAPVGVVLSPGIMPLAEVRRREMFDPALLHAGLDGMQRMADALDLGADPLDFAAAPAVVASGATMSAVRRDDARQREAPSPH